MSNIKSSTIVGFLFLMLVGLSCVYTIQEGQDGVLLKLGKLVRDSKDQVIIYGPGIHFKIPFINTPRIFDTRLQTLDAKTELITTVNKKDVKVDYYVKWRITNLSEFYLKNNGSQFDLERLLEQKLNSSLRDQFGKRRISEVVTDDRSQIMAQIRTDAIKSVEPLGIKVIDVRIKRIDLPDTVSQSIYRQMRAERQQVANQHRADGRAKSENIRATADKDATLMLAEARRAAESLKGEGDATAARIYADVYGKDPEFFAFYRSLNAYRTTFSRENDVLVLRPDNDFFKYFNHVSVASSVKR